MNEKLFGDLIEDYSYKNDFFEWIELTKYDLKYLTNDEKIKCFKYFNNNKNKIIELKKKILDKRF